jgi:Ca-activated chloride channel family protein
MNFRGYTFRPYQAVHLSPFDRLFEIFSEIVVHTSGDLEETFDWLKTLDEEYVLTNDDYTLDDFWEELKKRGYIKEATEGAKGKEMITAKTERIIRKNALDQIFGKLKRAGSGNHNTQKFGIGMEDTGELGPYQYGDDFDRIALLESIKNAQINHGFEQFYLREDDLLVTEQFHQSQMATVLMIDISHSMILYGEDRITPAKKVAMALAELITTRYPKDVLEVIVFGNDAQPIAIKDLPYLQVGPYHTNTVAGLELALDMLRKKKHANKQIFMITDGKPSVVRLPNGEYYRNSNGLDKFIVEQCYTMARRAKKLQIPITTFMIAQDPYLQQFVDEFTKCNSGKAFFTGLKGLGDMIFHDYDQNRKKKMR